MIDSLSKLYERMILNRVQNELDDLENQRPTGDAIRVPCRMKHFEVFEVCNVAIQRKFDFRKTCFFHMTDTIHGKQSKKT